MKAYIINIVGNEVSDAATNRCLGSHIKIGSPFEMVRFKAVTPADVDFMMDQFKIKWTYPWDKQEYNIKYGLRLTPYSTADKKKRMACFLSHYMLWDQCVRDNETMIVLEHDALWINYFEPFDVINSDYNIVGLNNPLGATRRADIFDSQIQFGKNIVMPVPTVDRFEVPQGLAGNSAYLIKPQGAKDLIEKVKELGAWPNDAIMCKQLIQGLGVTKKYYTKVQGTKSTTSA